MPYTEVIDPATPTGTDQVSQGDNQLRALKLALVERLETITEDAEEQPLRLAARAVGAPATLVATRYNTSLAAPSAVGAAQEVGGIVGEGYGATVRQVLGRILAVAREQITDAAAGGLWRVSATRVGTEIVVDLFDMQGDADDNLEIVAEKGIKFSTKTAGEFDFAGPLTELDKRVVATPFSTANGQPALFDAVPVAGVLVVDWANGPTQRITVTQATAVTFVGATAGGTYMLLVVQGGVGGFAITLAGWDFGTAPMPAPLATGLKLLVSSLYDGTEYVAGVGHVGV